MKIELHITVDSPLLVAMVDEVLTRLTRIENANTHEGKKIMTVLSDLQDQVAGLAADNAAQKAVIAKVVTDLDALAAALSDALAAASVDPGAIVALTTQIATIRGDLTKGTADLAAADTRDAPPAPAPAP